MLVAVTIVTIIFVAIAPIVPVVVPVVVSVVDSVVVPVAGMMISGPAPAVAVIDHAAVRRAECQGGEE